MKPFKFLLICTSESYKKKKKKEIIPQEKNKVFQNHNKGPKQYALTVKKKRLEF